MRTSSFGERWSLEARMRSRKNKTEEKKPIERLIEDAAAADNRDFTQLGPGGCRSSALI